MPDSPRTQDYVTRISALSMALDVTLAQLAALHGNDARPNIEALRDDLIRRFKNSSIPPEYELEHAELVRPALEALEAVFDSALRKI
jgi:hypothetical protein